MLSRLTSLAAYREDIARVGRPTLGATDGLWLEIALLTEKLGRLPPTAADARQAIECALREQLDEVPAASPILMLELEVQDRRDSFTRLRRLAEIIDLQDGGHLAIALLQAAEDAFHSDTIGRGRSMALRARSARVFGAMDVQHELARGLLRLAREEDSEELYGRACLCLAGLAFERGNYPAIERWVHRLFARATERMPRGIISVAEHFLLIRHAVAGHFGLALLHGWRAYEYCQGCAHAEAELLINMSKTLAEAGRPATAARGFIAAIARQSPERQAVIAWAGLVRCAADLGDAPLVELASARVLAMTSRGSIPYVCAAALVQSAIGRAQLGMAHEPWSSRASEFAESGGYHEIAHEVAEVRAGRPPSAPAAATLESESGAAARTIEEVIGALDSMARLDDAYAMS